MDLMQYNALFKLTFDISFHLVVLQETSDYEGMLDEHYAYQADDVKMDTTTSSDCYSKDQL